MPKESVVCSINFEGKAGVEDAMYLLMRNENYRDLVDFDNHLDDVSCDWRNLKLNKTLDDCIKNYR